MIDLPLPSVFLYRRMSSHWDLKAKEKLTIMRNSLELKGIPPIKHTVEKNLDPCVYSVRDLTENLSCPLPSVTRNLVTTLSSSIGSIILYVLINFFETARGDIYISTIDRVRYRYQEAMCSDTSLASFPAMVFFSSRVY